MMDPQYPQLGDHDRPNSLIEDVHHHHHHLNGNGQLLGRSPPPSMPHPLHDAAPWMQPNEMLEEPPAQNGLHEANGSFLMEVSNGHAPATPTGAGAQQQPKKSSSRRNAWGNLSYADLITQAIQSAPEKRLTLSQVYEWMVQNVPYFKDKGDSNSSAGWKNSIRHNLSLHSRFIRVQNEGTGKSSWWMLNPDVRQSSTKGARRERNKNNQYPDGKQRGRRGKPKATARAVTAETTPSPAHEGIYPAATEGYFNPDLKGAAGRTEFPPAHYPGRLSPRGAHDAFGYDWTQYAEAPGGVPGYFPPGNVPREYLDPGGDIPDPRTVMARNNGFYRGFAEGFPHPQQYAEKLMPTHSMTQEQVNQSYIQVSSVESPLMTSPTRTTFSGQPATPGGGNDALMSPPPHGMPHPQAPVFFPPPPNSESPDQRTGSNGSSTGSLLERALIKSEHPDHEESGFDPGVRNGDIDWTNQYPDIEDFMKQQQQTPNDFPGMSESPNQPGMEFHYHANQLHHQSRHHQSHHHGPESAPNEGQYPAGLPVPPWQHVR